MIRPEDDSFHRHHPGAADPHWNESAIYIITVPEREMMGLFYFYHRLNMNYTQGGVLLWDPSGMDTTNCLHYDWNFTAPLPAGADMYDFSLENGMTVACTKPLQSYRLAYKRDACEVDLQWEGCIPVQETGLPPGSDDWGVNHYEQAGRLEGTITLNGDTIPVQRWAFRDHSWGPRGYVRNPRASFCTAVASDQNAFAVWGLQDLPADQDPVIGTTERIIYGWYVRDGEIGNPVNGMLRVVERAQDGRPLRLLIEGRDNLGRELYAEGRCVNWLAQRLYSFMGMWWCLTEWKFDGVTAWGDEEDFFPIDQFRKFRRSMECDRAKLAK